MLGSPGSGRWQIFFQISGFIFCFLIFPVFVLNSSLMSLYELRLENHRQQVFGDLSQQLARLEPFNDERRYYHLLLRKVFTLAEQSDDPQAYLARALARLKSNRPGVFEFIVWDKNGAVVDQLTDEKRYRYVMKRLWEVMQAVRDHVNSGDPNPLKNVAAVKNNISLLKQFLGRVFLPETLISPWLPDSEASLILADYGRSRPYFWYQAGRSGGVLAFLSWDAVNDDYGLRAVIRAINRSSPSVTIGFSTLNKIEEPYLCRNTHFSSDVTMALARFENSSEQVYETDRAQIAVQMLNPYIRVFAVQGKDNEIYNPDAQRCRIITQLVALYLIGLSVLFFKFAVRRAFFSLRWKLLFLFLYANIAPLTVLAAISYDYLQNKKISLRNDIQLEAARDLRKIDTRFQTQSADFSARLNALIENINRENRGVRLNDAQIEMLRKNIYTFFPSEAFLVDSSGRLVFALDSKQRPVRYSNTYIKNQAASILQYHNRVIVECSSGDVFSRMSSPDGSDFVRNSICDSRKIWPMSVGDTTRLGYWSMIGDPQNYQNDFILLLLWDEQKFQEMYLQKLQRRLAAPKGLQRIFAMAGSSRSIVPEAAAADRVALENFLRAIQKSETNVFAQIEFAGESHIACGLRGRNMNRTSFAALYPVRAIDAQVAVLRRNIFAGAVVSLLVTMVIGLAVAKQFLVPVRELERAGRAIYQHQFKHRLAIADHDEFGHLAQVMNRVIEGLGELEIARIVQESLFPEGTLKVGSCVISGRSQSISTLGGDYYDYFVIDERHCGVVIGEASGNGVAAALIIAMVKACIKMATREELLDPASLTRKLHGVIWGLQRQSLNYLMTFEYLVLETDAGKGRMINAGHCFPVLICCRTRSIKVIEPVAFPLGVMKNPGYQNHDFTFSAGETLILCTDGAVGSGDGSGDNLSFQQLGELAMLHCDSDPETLCARLTAACLERSGSLTDDTTFVVVSNQEEASG